MQDNIDETTNWDDFQVINFKKNNSTIDSYNSYLTSKQKIKKLPMAELKSRDWIKSKNDLSQFIPYFQFMNNNEMGSALFRKTNTADEALYSFWLSRVVYKAKLKVLIEKIPTITQISKEDMKAIAKLSVNVNAILEIPNILKKFGIVVVYERSLPSMKLDGVVFLLPCGRPVISLSLRYSRLDNYWFTLMHEIAHICCKH